MNCEELKAKLNSQKAALLRIEAESMLMGTRGGGSTVYADYLRAKSDYANALRHLSAMTRGVRG
jgi:hypothetical protein